MARIGALEQREASPATAGAAPAMASASARKRDVGICDAGICGTRHAFLRLPPPPAGRCARFARLRTPLQTLQPDGRSSLRLRPWIQTLFQIRFQIRRLRRWQLQRVCRRMQTAGLGLFAARCRQRCGLLTRHQPAARVPCTKRAHTRSLPFQVGCRQELRIRTVEYGRTGATLQPMNDFVISSTRLNTPRGRLQTL